MSGALRAQLADGAPRAAVQEDVGCSPRRSVRPHTSQDTIGVLVLIDLRFKAVSRWPARTGADPRPLERRRAYALTASASALASSMTFCARWCGTSS